MELIDNIFPFKFYFVNFDYHLKMMCWKFLSINVFYYIEVSDSRLALNEKECLIQMDEAFFFVKHETHVRNVVA